MDVDYSAAIRANLLEWHNASQPSPTWVKDAAEELYRNFVTPLSRHEFCEQAEQILTRHAKGKV